MKKILFFFQLLGCTCLQAQISNSLSACYALDGNANDPVSALNGTTGAITNTLNRNNSVASAFNFSGSVTSKITLPDNVLLKASEMSFCAWIKAVNNGFSQYVVFTKNTASSNFEAYALVFNGSGQFVAIKGNNGSFVNVTSTTTVISNTWHHVAFTFDNANIKLYLDGNLEATLASTLVVGYESGKNVILGGSGESFNLPFEGCLDNVRFYSRAITAGEVSQIYTQDPVCVNLPVNLSGSLTACYALNNDVSEPISALSGTLGAVTATLDRGNNNSSAFSFNGSAASTISLPGDNRLKGKAMSLSAWVKPVNTGNSQYVAFTKNNSSSNFEAYALVFNGSGQFVGVKGSNGNAVNAPSTSTVTSNTWHHVALIFDTTSIRLYLDGVLEAFQPSTLTVLYESAKNVFLGGSGESFNLPFTGCVDNVRFYNRVINASEVNQLYLQDPACVITNTTVNTGVNETHDVKSGFKLYPNPTKDIICLELADGAYLEYRVRNVLGSVVTKAELDSNGKAQVDMANCSDGVYFVEVFSGTDRLIRKIIKH